MKNQNNRINFYLSAGQPGHPTANHVPSTTAQTAFTQGYTSFLSTEADQQFHYTFMLC